jgi:cell filamentation protein, protein adenylyltransferase
MSRLWLDYGAILYYNEAVFVPHYTLSDEVTVAIAEVERLSSQLNQSTIPTEVLDHIRRQCLIALTHFSTEIEGNKLTLEQVSGVVEKRRTYGLVRDEKEVRNYFRLLERLPELLRRFEGKVTTALILECHATLLEGIAEERGRGHFREAQNAIYEAASGKLVYLPPEPQDVPPLIDDLCTWVNDSKIHPVILAAVFHNQFVTIHPFIDGNGRSARLLSLYLLDARGYDWKSVVPIDRYYAEERGLYYRMLQQDSSHNYYLGRNATDFTKWVGYYAHGIKTILTGTLEQLASYKTRRILMNNRQAKILRHLESGGCVTNAQYAKRFGISSRMATRDLTQLVEWGRLSVIGKARATKYVLT